MARAEKPGDKFENARKRYRRSAARYLKMAEQSSGITADKYRAVAMADFKKALDTYKKSTTQNFAKPIRELAEKLGVNLALERKRLQGMTDQAASRIRNLSEKTSVERLVSVADDAETLRQAEAKAVFSSNVGQRIIGGLVDVWRDKATVPTMKTDKKTGKEYRSTKIDKKKMFEAIFDYFKVDNLADLLQKVEKSIGDRLYSDGETDTIYETVKLIIQGKVADNTLVA